MRSSGVRQIEMPLDPVEPLLHSVKAAVLHRDLRLEVRKWRLQMSQIHFQARHPHFEITELPAHLLAPCIHRRLQTFLSALQSFHSAPQNMELLHNEIGSFIDHEFNLVLFAPELHPVHSASAPEMISISSFVIIAWRVRL